MTKSYIKNSLLLIFFTVIFLSTLVISGSNISYAEGIKTYNSNGENFEIGSLTRSEGWHTSDEQFDTIQVFANHIGEGKTIITNPTPNSIYPTVNYSFEGAGFSPISSNYSYTSSKEVVVSGFLLGHMYTTYSNLGIEQFIKFDGSDANRTTQFSQIIVFTGVQYYLEFGSIDISQRPQFTATTSQYNGLTYNLYSASNQYISSDEATYDLSGLTLGSNIRWPDDTMYDLTLVEAPNVPQNGVYIKDNIFVYSFQYKPIIESPGVIIKYVESDTGQEITPQMTLTGNVGESYQSEKKDILGYTFKEIQGNPTGQFTDQTQTVSYVYTKNPVLGEDVTIKYVDENGNSILANRVKTGNVGEIYQSEQKIIPGYAFKKIEGLSSGKFSNQKQTVTYVYVKNKDDEKPNKQNLYSKTSQTETSPSIQNINTDTKNTTSQNLPQTGDNDTVSNKTLIIGLLTIMFGVTLTLFHLKHSK